MGLVEWSVQLSDAVVRPGHVTLEVTNAGGTVHDLVVEGEAGRWETSDLDPGDAATLQVRARPGETMTLWCDVPGHRSQGMETTLRVTASGGRQPAS